MRKPEMNKSKSLWMFSAVCASVLPYTTLVAGPSDAKSGSGPTGTADAEVIKRLQRIENARKAEADGDRLMADGDYEGAINKYQEALSGIPNAPMSAVDRARIISKFSNACIKQADKLGKMGRFDEAKTLLKRVLAEDVDQDNVSAKTLLKRLDDPDYYNPSMSAAHYKDTEEVTRLLKEGLGYFDLGQFNEAEASFNKILAIDPHNVAARRQLEKTEHEIDNYLISARDHTRAHMLRMVDEIWETAVPHGVPTGVGPKTGGNEVKGTAILMKLKNTNLQRLSFEQASIDEVIQYLRSKSVELDNLDPNKSGVNFILQTKGKTTPPITLDLRDVPMIVALDQICALAGLSYRVDSHAVVITSLDGAGNKLETRVFRVPPSFLSTAGTSGGGAPAAAPDPFAAPAPGGAAGAATPLNTPPNAQTVLSGLGANFEAAGSNATFLPGSSRLIVKNTLQQLDFIEKIIDDLTKTLPKQVNITTKFVEISQRNGEELGFDTLIGAFNVGSRTFGAGGTAGNQGTVNAVDYPFLDPNGSTTASPVVTGQNPVSNGLRSGSRAIATNAIDGLLANGIASQGAKLAAPGILSLAGVFTDPQFQIVLRALSQKKGVDLMTAPSIVTKSGQRAKIEIIREFPYPTDFDPPQIPQTFGATGLTGGGNNGLGGGTTATSASSFPVTPTTPTTFQVRNTGVTMEVDPVIGEDGYTIDLTLAPEVVEFEGFINYGSPINSSAINALGVPTTLTLTENRIEQPVFATRKLNTSVTIWDGQTVGIGGLMREDVQMVEDKVPLLGDIPFFGRLFKTKSEEHFKKNLMVYVSAVLIDPSGNRINTHREPTDAPVDSGAPGAPDGSLIPTP